MLASASHWPGSASQGFGGTSRRAGPTVDRAGATGTLAGFECAKQFAERGLPFPADHEVDAVGAGPGLGGQARIVATSDQVRAGTPGPQPADEPERGPALECHAGQADDVGAMLANQPFDRAEDVAGDEHEVGDRHRRDGNRCCRPATRGRRSACTCRSWGCARTRPASRGAARSSVRLAETAQLSTEEGGNSVTGVGRRASEGRGRSPSGPDVGAFGERALPSRLGFKRWASGVSYTLGHMKRVCVACAMFVAFTSMAAPSPVLAQAALQGPPAQGQAPIDRQALVARHRVVLRAPDVRAPLSVGNGSIAFTADVTGLQSYPEAYENGTPLATLSTWAWHSDAQPAAVSTRGHARALSGRRPRCALRGRRRSRRARVPGSGLAAGEPASARPRTPRARHHPRRRLARTDSMPDATSSSRSISGQRR